MTLGEVLSSSAEYLARKGSRHAAARRRADPRARLRDVAARAVHELRPAADRGRARAGPSARRAARAPRAARLRPRRVGLPPARAAHRRPRARARGRRRRSSSSGRSPRSQESTPRVSSTSARARERSRSRSPTSIPGAVVTATDISPDALALARENARPPRPRDRARRDEPARRPRRPLRPRRLEPALRPRRRDRRPPAGGARLGAAGSRSSATRPRRSPPRRATGSSTGGALVLESHADHAAELAAALGELGYTDATTSRATSRAATGWSRRDGRDRGAPCRARRCCSRPTACTACARSPGTKRPSATLYELKGRGAAQPTAGHRRERRRAPRGGPRAAAARCSRRSSRARTRSCSRTRSAGSRWLTGERPDTIGVRVARVPRRHPARPRRSRRRRRDERERAGRAGGGDPRRGCRAGSERAAAPSSTPARFRGTPSTVVDYTGPSPASSAQGAGDIEQARAAGATHA